jgi:hypothetical protein
MCLFSFLGTKNRLSDLFAEVYCGARWQQRAGGCGEGRSSERHTSTCHRDTPRLTSLRERPRQVQLSCEVAIGVLSTEPRFFSLFSFLSSQNKKVRTQQTKVSVGRDLRVRLAVTS